MEVTATMSGSVWKIVKAVGESVEIDEDIMILESMKMEIPIIADDEGVIKEIKVAEGDFVNEGDVVDILE